jgi:type VI secretion system protein ImpM
MSVGFYGKLPARGDFVRAGLPRGFVDPWDAWFQRGLAYTRETAPDWVDAWLEAPVWRFLLPPGCCGPDKALGLWLPSVDRAGRYFPLTIAAVWPTDPAAGFLDAAEQAGRDALALDLEPDDLASRLAAALDAAGDGAQPASPDLMPDLMPGLMPGLMDDQLLWWTAGGERVPATAFAGDRLPEGAAFAAMIDQTRAAPEDPP